MQLWNILTDRAQKVEEKNPRVNFDWNLENGSFFVFSADDSEKLITVLAKYLSASEISLRSSIILSISRKVVNRLWSYRNVKKLLGQ